MMVAAMMQMALYMLFIASILCLLSLPIIAPGGDLMAQVAVVRLWGAAAAAGGV